MELANRLSQASPILLHVEPIKYRKERQHIQIIN